MRSLRSLRVWSTMAMVWGLSGSADAGLWPNAPDQLRSELSSPDVGRRRAAASALLDVPRHVVGPLLRLALVDADLEVRHAAVLVAARHGPPELSELILPWLTDVDPRLREDACTYFLQRPEPRVVKVLARALGDAEPRVRVAAVAALGASSSTDAVAPLLARLDDTNSRVRLAVARALGRLQDQRAVTPLLSKVQDEATEVRQAVIRTLGDLGEARAAAALLVALRDPAVEVRIEALAALGRLRAADAVASIAPMAVDTARRTGVADVRRAALDALGRIGTSQAVEVIARTFGMLEDERAGVSPSPAREAALRAGQAAVLPLMTVLQTRREPAVLASAAWVLGQLRAPSAGEAIVGALQRGLLPTAAALHALASLGDPMFLAVGLEHVASADGVVRAEALAAVRAMLDPTRPDGRAVEPLLAAFEQAAPGDRLELARLLGLTGAERVVPLLAGLTEVKSEPLRVAALEGLASLGTSARACAPKLLTLVADPSAAVRLQAALSLSATGGAADTAAVFRALGAPGSDRLVLVVALFGLLTRTGDVPLSTQALAAADHLAAEADLLLAAVASSRLSRPTRALAARATEDVAVRRSVAVALGARPRGEKEAEAALLHLAEDLDATVRAQAVWSLGAVGTSDPRLTARLEAAARDSVTPVASNAVAALARVAKVAGAVLAPRALCAALDDDRVYVRANALTGLSLFAESACSPTRERALLLEDPHEDVRLAAARLHIRRKQLHAGEDPSGTSRLLDRCAAVDPSARVAERCRDALSFGGRDGTEGRAEHTLVVFVSNDEGSPPQEGSRQAPYVVERPEGFLHLGVADRNGAVPEFSLPRGLVRLRPPFVGL